MGKDKDLEMGYKKPPKHTQFKKGQSGNPKGRPKGRKNTSTIVNKVLNQKVMISVNGKPRSVSYTEALIQKMAAKGLSGATRDQKAMLDLINEYEPELLKEAELPHGITVRYVLPDGKTVEDYDSVDSRQPRAKINDTSPSSKDDNDDWLH